MGNSDGNKPIVPVLTGPTGSGKSRIVSKLLESHPDLDIISADSRQIYRRLNIGTDKPTEAELSRYNYRLVNVVEPGERYTAYDFARDAGAIIAEVIAKRGSVPLVCGGTGLYIRSLVEGIVELPDGDFSIRRGLEEEASVKGAEYIHGKLQKIDPQEASSIHPNNLRRTIRALEIYYVAGKPKSQIMAEKSISCRQWNYEVICLIPPREKLYSDINQRVDKMLKSGLVNEVEQLQKDGFEKAIRQMGVIGYDEIIRYLRDEITLESAVNLIKHNSRRFAKRQITWFKGSQNLKFMDLAEEVLAWLGEFWGSGK